jgi:hypothetical protein
VIVPEFPKVSVNVPVNVLPSSETVPVGRLV